jgi:hypothetical protein
LSTTPRSLRRYCNSSSGRIAAGSTGIEVKLVTTLRSISNAGTISAGADGIFVENASLFSGDIVNSGAGNCGRLHRHRGQAGHYLHGRHQQRRQDLCGVSARGIFGIS